MDDTATRVIEHYRALLGEAAESRLGFAEKMWRLQDEIALSASVVDPIDAGAARESLATGQPLFMMASPQIDPAPFIDAIARLAVLLADEAGVEDDVAQALRDADFTSAVDTEDLAGAVHNMDAFVDVLSANLGASDDGPLSPVVIRVIVASALAPLLRAQSAAHLNTLDDYDWKGWSSGSCPVCGAPAAMSRVLDEGELQGGRRMLWCSLCDAEWEYDRVRCARCGTRNHESLRYVMNPDDPGHRIHLCDECHGYLKTSFEGELGMTTSSRVEDVVTLELDAVARANGYTPLGDEDEPENGSGS